MDARGFFVLCALALGLYIAPALAEPPDADKRCPKGTLLEPYSETCARVREAKLFDIPRAKQRARELPHLKQMRKDKAEKEKRRLPREVLETFPPPGGIGAGTLYRSGALQALEHGELHTKMFVHPNGVNPSQPGLSWLFTTATNRTDRSVEVVGIYLEDGPGNLGLFDWSCSEDYPCAGGHTAPSWIATTRFENLQCNMTGIVDDGGHRQTIMQYVNQTRQLDDGSPPLWRNEIFLWNYCEDRWDSIYEHEYRTEKRDCSIGRLCAWWGPILETFSDTLPEIDEVGFEDTLLLHDGVWSELPPEETTFSDPVAPWLLFHIDPNRSYGAGSRVVVVSTVLIDILPGVARNPINPRASGGLWIAILSDSIFDPLQVDPSTVRFGPDEASAIRQRVRDVNRDGLADLLLRFRIPDTGIACGDREATLTGETFDGQGFTGTDSIRTIGCRRR